MAMRAVTQTMERKSLWVAGIVCCVVIVGYLAMPRPNPTNAQDSSANRKSAPVEQSGQPLDQEKPETLAAIPESKRHADDAVAKELAEKAKLRDLEKAVAEQEVKLTAARKELGNIVRTKGIVYQGPGGDYSGAENPNAKQDAADFVKTKTAVEAEMKTLATLKSELEKEKARLGIASPPEAK